MIAFNKTPDPDKHYDVSDVLIQLPYDSTLDEVLDTFERFLLACSFSFHGHVRIIEDEEQ
jgi:hypothetical protein